MPPFGQASFAEYQQQTRAWVAAHRAFQSADRETELTWNAPQEWRPEGTARKGILLIHGLGDAPGSFTDLGPALARQGFLVRTVLLAGHGTRPEDMLSISVNDWRQTVTEQAAILARDVDALWLGGFSTGANLAVEYASEHDNVQGLMLFSPCLKSKVRYDYLAPWVAPFRAWLRPPDAVFGEQISTRYLRVPTNGMAQYWYTSYAARRALDKRPWNKPAVVVLAQHDSVVDTAWIRDRFNHDFPHPDSRLIWYGNTDPAREGISRALARDDSLPAQRISQFSHMSVLFSPDNPLYGQNARAVERCMKGEEVWYSDWGYSMFNKVHARLTWNPWFSWQEAVLGSVANQTPAPDTPALKTDRQHQGAR